MKPLLAAGLIVALHTAAFAQDAAPKPQPAPAAVPAATPAQPDARQLSAKAIAYLKSQQDPKTGGWSVNPNGPSFPAITGLVINGMLMDPSIQQSDPAV